MRILHLLPHFLCLVLAGPMAGQELELFADLDPTDEPLVDETGHEIYGSNPSQMHRGPDGRAYFVAHDRLHGAEIWVTDGTPEGTDLYVDAIPGEEGSDPRFAGWLGDLLFFQGNVLGSDRQQLWRTDGTPAGTFVIFDAHPLVDQPLAWLREHRDPAVVAGGLLWVTVRAEEEGTEILRSDGTVEGTVLRDRYFGGGTGVSSHLAVAGDRVIAETSNGPGREGLRSIGADGEVELPLICPDGSETSLFGRDIFPIGEEPASLVALLARCPVDVEIRGDGLGLSIPPGPGQFFVTDGTPAGTRRLATAEIGTLQVIAAYPDPVHDVALPGGRTLFDVQLPGEIGGLWITDGSSEGTLPLRDATETGLRPAGHDLYRLGDRGVAEIALASGLEVDGIWLSDGTPFGFSSLPTESDPGQVKPAGRNHFVFTRPVVPEDDGPPEIVITDGTPAGTRAVGRLHPGGQNRFGGRLDAVQVGNRILIPGWKEREAGSELWSVEVPPPSPCNDADVGSVCLHDGRFEVRLRHVDPGTGTAKLLWPAKAGRSHEAGGLYWFFGPQNLEVAVKLLDGRPINGHWWLFAGTLTELEFEIEVTDHLTGASRSWHRGGGDLCGLADVEAFDDAPVSGTAGSPAVGIGSAERSPETAPGKTDPVCPDGSLCLQDGGFALDVDWRVPATGESGTGVPVPFEDNDATGAFYFFGEENRELLVQILDGRPINDRWWIFWGAQTDLPLELRVRDLETGRSRVFTRDGGDLCGDRDLFTFVDSP